MGDPPRSSESQAAKCAKCGTLNPAGVEECLCCRDSLLPPETPPTRNKLMRVPPSTRLVSSLVVGLLVFGISCVVAYRQCPGTNAALPQRLTLAHIGRVCRAIEAYRQEKHALPTTLGNLPSLKELYFPVDADGVPVDSWQRELQYWTDGTNYRVTSYGRDRKPGGVGFDYDLSSDDLPTKERAPTDWWRVKLPEKARPTFGQFVTDPGSPPLAGSGRMTFVATLLAGAVAFVLGFYATGGAAPVRRGIWGRLGRLLIIAAATLLVTIMYLIPLDLYPGH